MGPQGGDCQDPIRACYLSAQIHGFTDLGHLLKMGLLNFGWDLKNFDKLTDKSWTPSENIDLYQSPYIFFILKIFMKYISFHELLEFSKAALMPVLLERVEDII